MKTPSQFEIGSYRPIYLWDGPGTVRMNQLKFMGVPVDEFVHYEAHTPAGANRVLNRMYCNWVHLMYDWGFPPEVEEVDWSVFEQAAAVYNAAGTKVLAYIQTSNCVYDGSFRGKDWYAADPRGKRIAYFVYRGRYMVCLGHPAWKQHLKDLIRGAVERGADGIFFDNLLQGEMPISLFGTWLGTTGCHCPRCQRQYLEETGRPIPAAIRPEDPEFARYLRWRADQVTQLVAEMAAYARELQPGTLVSANDYDPIVRDAYLMQGIDLRALADVQDVAMIENYGLPRWDGRLKPRLVNNALTARTARAVVGRMAHLSLLSYDVAIGFDPVYPPRHYRQGIAEAAACGASMTTKGTEYRDGKKMTLLTAREYAPVHATLGQYHRWLEASSRFFTADRRNVAPVGLLYPGDALWLRWHRLAPLYFGAGQALTAEGIPWRVIQAGDSPEGLRAILVFEEAGLQALSRTAETEVIFVPGLKYWHPRPPSVVSKIGLLRRVLTLAMRAGLKAYGDVRLVRRVADRAGLPRLITQSPLYRVPAGRARQTLLDALPADVYPRSKSKTPALIEVWQDGEVLQVHLVNYAASPQVIQVHFQSPVIGQVVSPDGQDDEAYEGAEIEVPLDVYIILLVTAERAKG
ncbi:MAG: hypothetical protein JSV36_00540 [Anaerolineae bacterium]|nr:MAG: hypothetical protein JSV36_00540 [Anaerolineae bacterium]